MITIKFENRVPELTAKVQNAVSQFVRAGSLHLVNTMKVSMADRKSGRTYPRGKIARHQASAPGESPAVDSGNYINSIVIDKVFETNALEALIGTVLPYAKWLEDGTNAPSPKDGNMGPLMGGIRPRPLWAKTVEQELPTLDKLLEHYINRV